MAKAHQEIGESQIAAGYFRRCLIIRPNDVNTWLNLGHCHVEIGQRDAGYECFRTAARGVALLGPCPDEALKIWPVAKAVGNVRNKGRALVNPI